MENAGSWTVSGSRETMEVPKNFKDLGEFGVRNITQYSAANAPFPALFSTDIHFFHTPRHVYRSVWPARKAKPRFGAALDRSAHDCKTGSFSFQIVQAYKEFMLKVGKLLGGEPNSTAVQMEEVYQFEKNLAELYEPKEKLRNTEQIYHKMTVADLQQLAPAVSAGHRLLLQ